MDSGFSAYNEVLSMLNVLEMMLCWFDDDFGSGISFSSVFEKLDLQIMYHQFKHTESLFTNSADEYLLIRRLEIAEIAHEIRDCIASKVKMFRIWNKEEHFVLYDAVVSLLHDLELILSSHGHTCDSEHQFRIGDIQIMYDNLSMMDSLLVDSSGHGYDKKLMYRAEHWVSLVAYRGRAYIDLWPQSLVEKQSTGSFPPSSKQIFDDRLHKTTRSMEYVNRELMGLPEKQATGSFPPSSKHISDDRLHELTRRMEYINRTLISLTETQPNGSFPPSFEHIFELQGTTSADGAAQVSCQNLHQITKSIEFVNNLCKRIRDGRDIIQTSTQSLQGTTSTGQVFIKVNKLPGMPNEGAKLVGFQHEFSEMLDRLTGYPPKLQVLTVVGMGGIGKTTFTESLYDNPFVRYHFHIRAWLTISQQYQVKEVLVGLLRCLTSPTTEIYERSNEELKQTLYQSLKGMKYLIVLDDMWDKQAWNDLKRIFPNDENGSRIILTTRLREVAKFASPDTQPHYLPRLNPDESWELLCSKIQINEFCPPELEPIGKQIACRCQGLPLAIVVVAGLLSKMNMTLVVWEEIAKSACSIVMEEQEQCHKLLSLSYNHLPDHLKRCFLYMGHFPEDSKISAKKLVWLWIGEGFMT